jgi:hypothetical protein
MGRARSSRPAATAMRRAGSEAGTFGDRRCDDLGLRCVRARIECSVRAVVLSGVSGRREPRTLGNLRNRRLQRSLSLALPTELTPSRRTGIEPATKSVSPNQEDALRDAATGRRAETSTKSAWRGAVPSGRGLRGNRTRGKCVMPPSSDEKRSRGQPSEGGCMIPSSRAEPLRVSNCQRRAEAADSQARESISATDAVPASRANPRQYGCER